MIHVGDGFLLTMDILYIEFKDDIVSDYYVALMNI